MHILALTLWTMTLQNVNSIQDMPTLTLEFFTKENNFWIKFLNKIWNFYSCFITVQYWLSPNNFYHTSSIVHMFNRWHKSPHAKLWCLCSKVIMRSVRGPSGVSKIMGCPVGFIWQCGPHAQHKTFATEVIGGLGVDKVIGLKQAHVLQIPRNAVDLVKPHENITKHTFHKLIKQH